MVLLSRGLAVLLPVLGFVLSATPAHESASADRERNRRLLSKWKADPEHYARLQQDLRDFWALPEEQRLRLRALDRELHQLDDKTQKRLWKTAERYTLWLERLPDEDRQQIETAGDSQEKLRRIREIRQRQTIERLPKRIGDELRELPAEERTARLAKLREQEQWQRKLWQRPLGAAAPRLGKPPTSLRELPPDARQFIEKNVLPRLSDEEQARLRQAEGRPEFVAVVKHLSEQHPVLPPLPAPHKPITRYEDLPDRAKVEAGSKPSWERRTQVWEKLHKVEGKWPEWALAFHAALTPEQRQQMPPLGASRPSDFSPQVGAFIEQTLTKKISLRERKDLRDAEGRWPEYPKRLLELAHKHKLEVPGLSLPAID